jgi:hypothetical protein
MAQNPTIGENEAYDAAGTLMEMLGFGGPADDEVKNRSFRIKLGALEAAVARIADISARRSR